MGVFKSSLCFRPQRETRLTSSLSYYLIHDYGDRQELLGFYHEEACFFLTIPFHSKDSGL